MAFLVFYLHMTIVSVTFYRELDEEMIVTPQQVGAQ